MAVPEHPIFVAYTNWTRQQSSSDAVAVCVQNVDDFTAAWGEESLRATWNSILTSGRPALLWQSIIGRKPAQI